MSGRGGEDFHKRIRRLEQLIQAVEVADEKIARSDALEIVRSLLELHGAGLERLVSIVKETDTGAALMRRLADDDLIAGLFLLYDLHPDDDETRIRRALDKVRPYLRSHGGDVELIDADNGTVRLRLKGSCQGCPSSAMTLKLAVEEAVYEAAPNTTAVVAEGSTPSTARAGSVPDQSADSGGSGNGKWETVPEITGLVNGGIHSVQVAGRSVLFCRIGETYYAYGSICPGCNQTLQSSRLENDRLICMNCMRQYDLVLAGRNLDDPDLQLEPLPLLVADGGARIALPELRP